MCILICEAITTYSLFCLCLSSRSWFLQGSIWPPFLSTYPLPLTTLTRCLYLFPTADVRNHHKLSGFKQHKCIRSQSWRSEGLKSKCWQLCVPAGGSTKALVPSPSLDRACWQPLLHVQGQQSSIFKPLFLWPLLPSSHLLSDPLDSIVPVRMLVIAFYHLDNLMFKIHKFITSAKCLLPYEVIYLQVLEIWGEETLFCQTQWWLAAFISSPLISLSLPTVFANTQAYQTPQAYRLEDECFFFSQTADSLSSTGTPLAHHTSKER